MKFELLNFTFDAEKVIAAADRAIYNTLREVGGYLRKSMMNSIKPGPYGKISPAGSPPLDHYGAAGRIARRKLRRSGVAVKAAAGWALGVRYILFEVDKQKHIVNVGFAGKVIYGDRTVPDVLEHGGLATRWDGKTFWMQARPTAQPALDRALSTESDRFRNLWANSVKESA